MATISLGYLTGLLQLYASETCNADNTSAKSCTSSCGHIHNISHPFLLNDDPKYCGDVRYTLYCESNITVLDFGLPSSGKYLVQAINYTSKTIRLLDFGLQSNNCSSMSQNIPPIYDIIPLYCLGSSSLPIYYLMCSNPLNSSLYVDTSPCLNNTSASSSSSQPKKYSYVMVGDYVGYRSRDVWDLDAGCSVEWMSSLTSWALGYVEDYSNFSYKDIHNALMYGFVLYFEDPYNYTQCPGWIPTDGHTCLPHTISGFFQYLWDQIGHEYIWSGICKSSIRSSLFILGPFIGTQILVMFT